MSNQTKLILIGIGALLVMFGLVAVASLLWQSGPPASQQPGAETPTQVNPPDPGTQEQPPTGSGQETPSEPQGSDQEDHDFVYVQNIEVLFGPFSDVQALFINDSVIEYATQQFNTSELFINEDSVRKRSPNTYGFSVTDGQQALFYVVATKRPGNNVEVKFF